MAIAEELWSRAGDVLSSAPLVALVCHVDPDGDALGSMLALRGFLEARGVPTVAAFPTSPGDDPRDVRLPAQYGFLPGSERLTPPADFPAAPDVLVALDAGSPDRLGDLEPSLAGAGVVIVVDHHVNGTPYGDIRLVEGDAAATAVLVEELVRRMGGELDADMATCLYTGLVTDTGRFQHPSTTPEVMRLGARLLAAGVDQSAVSRRVWETHSFGYVQALGRALERAQLAQHGGLVWTAVRQADLTELGLEMAEVEGVIDVLRGVESADVALVLKEQATGEWKASLRSRGSTDVGAVAEGLGGGGHRFAAGFTASGSAEEIADRVAAAVRPRAGAAR
jgi:phosphoesterase RecJ-like protein